MTKFKIKNKRYSIKPFERVTLGELIQVMNIEKELDEISERDKSISYEDENYVGLKRSNLIETTGKLCEIAAILSDVPINIIETLPARFIELDDEFYVDGDLNNFLNLFKPVLKSLRYDPYGQREFSFSFRFAEKVKHGRKSGRTEYFIFQLGENTVRQQSWMEYYWKEFFTKTTDEVVNFNFEHLPRLIAVSCYKKNEVDIYLGKAVNLKEKIYKEFESIIEDRAKLFLHLPLPNVWQFLDAFFFCSMNSQRTSRTSMKVDRQLQELQRRKSSTLKIIR